MPNIGAPELIIIAIALIVLFGATKLPTFARSIGRSMRIFKSEVKGLQGDDKDDKDDKDEDGEQTKASAEEPAEQAKPELTETKSPAPEANAATPSQQSTEQR